MKKESQKLTKVLGIKNLKVSEEMFNDIMQTSNEDSRSLQHQIRWLLDLGLKFRKLKIQPILEKLEEKRED